MRRFFIEMIYLLIVRKFKPKSIVKRHGAISSVIVE